MDPVVVPVVWSLIAGACFSLGAVYLMAWLNQVGERGHLALFVLAMSLGALILCELAIMRSATPQQAGRMMRWTHVPVASAVCSIVASLHFYFGSRRLWLGLLACALRLLATTLDFALEPNLDDSSLSGLQWATLFGEPVAVPTGVASPWMMVGQLSSVALLLYAIDAAMTGWRKGTAIDRRRAVAIGGSLVLFVVLFVVPGAGYSALATAGVVEFVFLFSVPALIVMLAMAFETGADSVRSVQLTARLQASEAELRRCEQRLKDVVAAAGVGVWEWDVQRDAIWVSEQTRALHGLSPDAPIDLERFSQTVIADDRASVVEAAVRASQRGGAFEQSYRVVLPTGRRRWLRTHGRADADGQGNGVLLRGVSLDITERRLAEDRYRGVVEDAPYGLLMADGRGIIEYANASAALIFGYARAELVGLALDALMPGCLDEPPAARARPADSTDPASSTRLRRRMTVRRKEGTSRTLEVCVNGIDSAQGVTWLAMAIDVSELNNANQQIERERAFLRCVIDTMPGLVYARDRQGRYTLANQATADQYARPVAELIGLTDADLNRHADEACRLPATDPDVMQTRRARVAAEERISGADGQTRWWMTTQAPIIDAHGDCNQVLLSSIDITARKRAERQVEQQRNELAHLSRVTMLSELSGSLTHELNQPLAAILSNAQAALRFLRVEQPNMAEVCEILQDIVSDDRRAGEVIRSLRLMLKRGEVSHEVFDVNELVRDVLKLVRGDVLNAGIALALDLAPTLPPLSGNKVQLQQVLLNLIINASEAMSTLERPERQLRVSTRAGPESGVQVGVNDAGVGIPSDDLERVFEPFFTTKPQGLGLGLAVCRRIMFAHGGRLWAESGGVGGSTFFFTLPGSANRSAS